jgi:hypothetical protein
VLERDLELGLAALLNALRGMPETDCEWPSPARMEEMHRAIEEVRGPCPYPSVRVFGWIDGLRLRMLNPDSVLEQTLWYNKWFGSANATNILVGTGTGKFIVAILNNPGSRHDFTVARPVFERLASIQTPLYHILAGDSAFASNATNTLIGTKETYIPPAADVAGKTARELRSMRKRWVSWIGAVRQSTEHMMRTLQAVWGRLKTKLTANAEERARIIETCVRLHNFNAEYMTSHNQAQTMYNAARAV